jgi:CheY-like chemotaxis protein
MAGIAVTGSGGTEDRRRSSESGFALHLVKPVQIEDLQAAIHGALQGRHAAQR